MFNSKMDHFEMFKIIEIRFGSGEYLAEKELRNKILRMPIGLSLNDNDVRNEDKQHHIGAFDGENNLIGCVIVKPANGKNIIRQMAVSENFQRMGIGKMLMDAAEKLCASSGSRKIELHARKTAVPFYQKLGYEITSEEYIEVGIPHFTMGKSLNIP